VGALTALPYRFKARPWDLRQHITICPWCSNGCSVRLITPYWRGLGGV